MKNNGKSKRLKRLICISSLTFLLAGCNEEIKGSSVSKESNVSSTNNESAYSDHQDGESSIYSYSSSSFAEFKDFVSDFKKMNSVSFACFDFDNYSGMISDFLFEGSPVPTLTKRNDVSKTTFQYFKFSFSFLEEKRETVSSDDSRLLKIDNVINLGSPTLDDLSYKKKKENSNKWNISIYSKNTLISSLYLSFNKEHSEDLVNDYCNELMDKIVLL